MKSKFATYFDFVFKLLIIFIIALIWFRSYFHNNSQILIYSLLTTAIFGIILSLFTQKKENKIKNNRKELMQISLMTNELTFNTIAENIELLNSALKNNYETKKYKNYLNVNINSENYAFVVDFENNNLNENNILKIYKQFKQKNFKKLFVCCNNFDKNAFDLTNKIKNLNIILLNKISVYNCIFKKYNYTFENKALIKQSKKEKFKSYLQLAFNRKKTKNYFFAGLILLIGSIFMRYNIYYLIWTSILFIFALFSFFNKPFNAKTQKDIFDQAN